jgi:hypothetical protein
MFLPSPEHRDGMVEVALLHAHHMFDGLCERAQPHDPLFLSLALLIIPCAVAVHHRRYAVVYPCPAFVPCLFL